MNWTEAILSDTVKVRKKQACRRSVSTPGHGGGRNDRMVIFDAD